MPRWGHFVRVRTWDRFDQDHFVRDHFVLDHFERIPFLGLSINHSNQSSAFRRLLSLAFSPHCRWRQCFAAGICEALSSVKEAAASKGIASGARRCSTVIKKRVRNVAVIKNIQEPKKTYRIMPVFSFISRRTRVHFTRSGLRHESAHSHKIPSFARSVAIFVLQVRFCRQTHTTFFR